MIKMTLSRRTFVKDEDLAHVSLILEEANCSFTYNAFSYNHQSNKSLLSTAKEADKQLLVLYTDPYRLGEIVTVCPKLCANIWY